MNLKKINRYFFLFYFFIIFSCQSIDKLNNKNEIVLLNKIDEFENVEKFSNNIKIYNNENIDYFTTRNNFVWQKNKKLNKVISFNSSSKKIFGSKEFNIFILPLLCHF